MATRKAKGPTARTTVKSAGKPVQPSATPSAATRAAAKRSASMRPTQAELDLRDRLKSGPRRPAGPPLTGDTPTQAAMDALRSEVVTAPTDPKKRKGRA